VPKTAACLIGGCDLAQHHHRHVHKRLIGCYVFSRARLERLV
jgi:hypothetical protein